MPQFSLIYLLETETKSRTFAQIGVQLLLEPVHPSNRLGGKRKCQVHQEQSQHFLLCLKGLYEGASRRMGSFAALPNLLPKLAVLTQVTCYNGSSSSSTITPHVSHSILCLATACSLIHTQVNLHKFVLNRKLMQAWVCLYPYGQIVLVQSYSTTKMRLVLHSVTPI